MNALWALLVVPLVLGMYLRGLAGRLDRLHVRLEAARAALDAQLVRRTAAALELAHSGLLDPASSLLLADEAYEAQNAGELARESAESQLTEGLRAALPDQETFGALQLTPGGTLALSDLRVAVGRVPLARQFYNDAVQTTQQMRRRRVVRWFRLAGSAAWPDRFEMDDAPPPTLSAGP